MLAEVANAIKTEHEKAYSKESNKKEESINNEEIRGVLVLTDSLSSTSNHLLYFWSRLD
ncbi:MAG: hypothetical protein NC341_13600 [Blautia sp.]|nr:hypothetical protein [Blautia sp.]MCM1200107.1 hypothetical protein [Bacteroides fragilis]